MLKPIIFKVTKKYVIYQTVIYVETSDIMHHRIVLVHFFLNANYIFLVGLSAKVTII